MTEFSDAARAVSVRLNRFSTIAEAVFRGERDLVDRITGVVERVPNSIDRGLTVAGLSVFFRGNYFLVFNMWHGAPESRKDVIAGCQVQPASSKDVIATLYLVESGEWQLFDAQRNTMRTLMDEDLVRIVGERINDELARYGVAPDTHT